MDRIFIIWCLFLIFPVFVRAQTYIQRFEQALHQRDTAAQKKLLTEWWLDKSKDPDLRVAYFNFYKQQYELTTDSLAKNQFLSQALSAIDEGIINFPNRLDMPLLKIALLGEAGRYDEYTQTILTLLDRHDRVKDEWHWKNGASLVNATNFLLQYVDNFVVQLYNRQNESLHPYMDQISERVLRSYPTHIPSLSNLAITALYRRDYETGISHLEKALALDNKNTAVLNNLAYACAQTGQVETAIGYYNEVIKYGDAKTQEYAKKEIEKLNQAQNR